MIAPIATTRRQLSSLSLALSLFPGQRPLRDALQANADHFSNLVTWATIVVIIGVVFEAVEFFQDIVAWKRRKSRHRREKAELEELGEVFPITDVRGEAGSHPEPKWVKWALRSGLLLVVIGVVGEGWYGAKLEDAHNAIHKYDVAKLVAADKKAGDAADSAKTAHEEADAVKREADALDLRIKAASKQLGILEHDVLTQGPRWKLLEGHKGDFVKELKPFANKKSSSCIAGFL